MWMESKGSFTMNSNEQMRRCRWGGTNQQAENRDTASLAAFPTSWLLFYIFFSFPGFQRWRAAQGW